MTGDITGADIDRAANVTVGKENSQQTVTVGGERNGVNELNEVWRAVQRIESKQDLAISEQGRLAQQYTGITHQLSMLTQQVTQIAAQVVQLVGQMAQIVAANAERDRRVESLERQQAQRGVNIAATTTTDRVIVALLALAMLSLLALNVWGGI